MAKEQRTKVRERVRWAAHATSPTVHFIGVTVHDVSEKGVFLENATGERPALGQHLSLQLFPKGQGQGVEADGVVCGIGFSSIHKCDGVGIAFDHPLATKLSYFD